MATDSTDPGDRDGGTDDKDPNEPRSAVLCPGGDRVVILRDEPIGQIGNILIPDTAKRRTTRGRVVAMGPGKVNAEWQGGREPFPFDGGLHVGDVVLIGQYSGSEVEFGGTEYTIINAGDILAKIAPGD